MRKQFEKVVTSEFELPNLQNYYVVGQGRGYILLERPSQPEESAPKKRNRKAKEVPEAVEA